MMVAEKAKVVGDGIAPDALEFADFFVRNLLFTITLRVVHCLRFFLVLPPLVPYAINDEPAILCRAW